MAGSYNAKDIVVLEGLDAVRLRPGMYIGTTGVKGLHHLLWEIVDNSIDEISNGYGKKITVTLHADKSVTVEDDGRGVPVDIHPIKKVSAVELVFTQLHAGGKFNNANYNFSGGLHGVGASVVNALSEWLTVNIFKDGKEYEMKFASIKKDNGKIQSGAIISPLKMLGPTDKSGTCVRFKPDPRVFGENETFEWDTISKRLKELAFLNKGVEIALIDERETEHKGYFKRTYKYDGGVKDFCLYLNEAKTKLFDQPIYVEGKTERCEVYMALQYTDSFSDSVFSYVNNIPTPEGGTHETGLRSGLTRVFNDFARKQGLLKEKEDNFLGDDFKEGLTAVLLVKMNNVQFEGQTKTKLGNPEIKSEVEGVIVDKLSDFLARKENKKTFEEIIKKARLASNARIAAKKAKELTRQKNSVESLNLVGKLSACSGRKAEINELFIVEGDSAGGTAKQARDRSFQAILPLRGKPLNAEKKRLAQVLANEEIRTIISALGAGLGDSFNLENLKYYKVIILADADQDGAHIRSILLTFFYRYMKDLISSGHVYIGMPPLYKVYNSKKEIYVYSDVTLQAAIDKIGKGYMIQRYKGLGEMNSDQLWETTMDPKTRSLMQVNIEDGAEAEKLISTWMGDDVEVRRNHIFENAEFNKEDTFLKYKK